jgi:hypothetical protein
MAPFELIVSAVSASSKEPEGEDRVRTVSRAPGPSGVIVCDGVGSMAGSAAMAEEASELGAALLGGHEIEPAIWTLDRHLERTLPPGRGGATTVAVVCADQEGTVGHLLLGNGSIIEVAPMEVEPGKERLLWTSIALPQMAGNEGRPALRSFLPPEGTKVEAEKGIRKVPAGMPRLYLACSDGFLSEEDRLEGPAPDGTVWRQVPKRAADLMELLTSSWKELHEKAPDDLAATLKGLIERAIEDPESDDLLDDDTTVGALYLRPAESGDQERERSGR